MPEEAAQELAHLIRLQAVDLERARLATELKAIPNDVLYVENQLKAASAKVATAEQGLKREELLRASQELEIAGLKTKAARHRKQMDTATNATQAAALDHEIAFAEKEIARLEEAEFLSLETSETLEADLAKARQLAGKLSETLADVRARTEARSQEIQGLLATLTAERETLRTALAGIGEGARLAQYDRISKRGGTGLATANGQQCSGCRMGIRAQLWMQLRNGEVLTCESCGRIQYVANEPEAPRTPESTPPDAALGGASIRRRS